MKMSFYLNTPKGKISLKNLTQYVLTRLRLLFKILDAGGDRMLLQDIFQELATVEESECLIEGTLKDKISHFMLRLACCENAEMSVFFENAESALFDWRFSCMTEQELCKLLKSLDPYLHIGNCRYGNKSEKSLQDDIFNILKTFTSIKEAGGKWRTVVRRYLNGELSHCFYVPFQNVLKLVQQREVHLKDGVASVPFCQLRTVVCDLYGKLLHLGVEDARRNKQTDDERILNLTKTVRVVFRQQFKQKTIHHISAPRPITNGDIDGLVEYFPPCMSHAFWLLRRKHRLRHHTRIQLTLFLKELGQPIHEALAFWRNEYSQPAGNHGDGCSHDWRHHERRYTYNIRHLYGLEGSRINYRSHSCKYLQDEFKGHMEEGGCPFNHSDRDNLTKILENAGSGGNYEKIIGSGGNYEKIIELAANGCYTLACSKFLNQKMETLRGNRQGLTKELVTDIELLEDKRSFCCSSDCSSNRIRNNNVLAKRMQTRCKDKETHIVAHLEEDHRSTVHRNVNIGAVCFDERNDLTAREVHNTQCTSIVAQAGVVTHRKINHRFTENRAFTTDDIHSEIRNDFMAGEVEYTQCRSKKVQAEIIFQKEEDSNSSVNGIVIAKGIHSDISNTAKLKKPCCACNNKSGDVPEMDAQDSFTSSSSHVQLPFRPQFSKPLDYFFSYKAFIEKLKCMS